MNKGQARIARRLIDHSGNNRTVRLLLVVAVLIDYQPLTATALRMRESATDEGIQHYEHPDGSMDHQRRTTAGRFYDLIV